MPSLLAQLGVVCGSCAAYNEPGAALCTACGKPIEVALWVKGEAAPAPKALEPVARSAPPGPPARPPEPPRLDPPARPPPILKTPGPAAPILARAAPATCPSCKAALQGAPLFCPACGTRLADEARLAARKALSGAPIAVVGAARLVLLRGTERENEAFRLMGERTEVGHSRGQLTFAHDDTLPPLAAAFVYREGRLVVQDLGGRSGTYVRIRAPEVLNAGDTFAIGDRLLRFSGRLPAPALDRDGTTLQGAPRPPGASLLRIEIVHAGGAAGRAWVRPVPLRIGRAIGDVLFGEDPFVSARHCELDADPGGVLLRDLGSSNGTFVRVPARGERALLDGDYVRLGKNVMRVEIT